MSILIVIYLFFLIIQGFHVKLTCHLTLKQHQALRKHDKRLSKKE